MFSTWNYQQNSCIFSCKNDSYSCSRNIDCSARWYFFISLYADIFFINLSFNLTWQGLCVCTLFFIHFSKKKLMASLMSKSMFGLYLDHVHTTEIYNEIYGKKSKRTGRHFLYTSKYGSAANGKVHLSWVFFSFFSLSLFPSWVYTCARTLMGPSDWNHCSYTN